MGNIVDKVSDKIVDNLTTCQIIEASERASDLKKDFICFRIPYA